MKHKFPKIHIGLRTVKTSVAVILAMLLVEAFGTTDSKLIFAMLGAMAAMEPTFQSSLEACISQIIGVAFGALCSVVLTSLPVPSLVQVGIGIILVITLYNVLKIRFSPGLPIFVVVLICTTPDIAPFSYAVGRIWDNAIGLAVGLLINTLIFPYDNSRQIRATAYSLDKELIAFLEELFDGDDIFPEAMRMRREIDTLERQLKVFENQRFLLNARRKTAQKETFQACEEKAKALITHIEVLCAMGEPGRLDSDNRQRLTDGGAEIRDQRVMDIPDQRDIVTNYHVARLLELRQELLRALEG